MFQGDQSETASVKVARGKRVFLGAPMIRSYILERGVAVFES